MQNTPLLNQKIGFNTVPQPYLTQAPVQNATPQANTTTSQPVVQTPSYAYPANYYLTQPGMPQAQSQDNTKTVVPPTSSGVNIMIFNPSATTPNGQVNNSCNYVMPSIPTPQPVVSSVPAPVQKEDTKPVEPPVKEEPKEEVKTKKVTVLTDELIQSIENYLRNPNKTIRKQGATKLVELFAEDSSRKNDIALTNLLNLMLQDRDESIRLLGISAINQGLAKGDELTGQLINNLTTSQTEDSFNQTLASQAALNRLGEKVSVEVSEQ